MRFTYIASNQKGKLTEGEMEAQNQEMVLEYLQKRDLLPVSVSKKNERQKVGLNLAFFQKVTVLDKIMFSRNLALMIKAGVNLAEAIDIMIEDAQKPLLRKIFSHIKSELEKGGQISDALAAFPKYFPTVFISMIKAGEASGNLENTLMQMSDQLKKENALRKKVKSAMAYPAILVTMAGGVVVLLVTLVLPRVAKIFAQSNVKLPLITRALLAVSDFVTQSWLLALIIFAFFIALIYILKKSAIGRKVLYSIMSKTPVVRELVQKVALTRFNRTLNALLKSGMPIIKALEITADSIGNAVYKKVILDMAKNEISKGVSFGMALKRRPEYFPALTTSMIVVGEKSGNLEIMLGHLADFYDEEVDGTLKSLVTILEPVLLLGVGLIIGTLALSIIMPIYQMIGTVR